MKCSNIADWLLKNFSGTMPVLDTQKCLKKMAKNGKVFSFVDWVRIKWSNSVDFFYSPEQTTHGEFLFAVARPDEQSFQEDCSS